MSSSSLSRTNNKLKVATNFLPPASPSLPVAVQYRRVSFIGGRGAPGSNSELLSPELQADPFPAVCALRGWLPDESLSAAATDLDESAFRKHWRKRPGIVRLLNLAEAGKFQVLVVLTVSRLARRLKDFTEIVEAFRAAGVDCYFIRESLDTSSPFGRAMLSILAVFAELEAESTSAWTSAAAARRRAKGKQHARPPFWIDIAPDGAYSLNPTHAATIRRLVELRLPPHSLGLKKLARTLNDEKRYKADGKPWSDWSLTRYLSPDYLLHFVGTAVLGEFSKTGERQLAQGAYPAVLDDETAARLTLNERRIKERRSETLSASGLPSEWPRRSRRGRALDTRYLLSGLSVCGVCGEALSGHDSGANGKTPDYRMYLCHKGKLNPSGHGGKSVGIPADNAEEAVVRVLRAVVDLPPEPEMAAPLPSKKQGRKSKPTPEPAATVASVETEMEKIAMLFAKGAMLETVYLPLFEKLKEKRARLLDAEAARLAPDAIPAALKMIETVMDGSGSEGGSVLALARSAVLLLVESVTMPLYRPDLEDPNPRRLSPRRFLRVTLHPGVSRIRVWDAPIYNRTWTGAREVYPATPSIPAE